MTRKLVVFDFDGTIVNSKPCFAQGLKEFSEARDLPHDIEKMTIGYVDATIHDLGWQLSIEEQIPLMKEFGSYMDAQVLEHKRLIPTLFDGIDTVIRDLHADYDLGIVTVRDRGTTLVTLDHYGLKEFFPRYRTHCCAKDRNYRIKPHPDALLCLLEESGHPIESVIMIGDTNSDIDMAHAVGIKSIAALWGMYPKERLEKSNPHAMLENVKDIPKTIAELFIR